MHRIYLDHHATTPMDPAVFEAMRPYFVEHFGNPSSGQHEWGRKAEAAVAAARQDVAALVDAKPEEIVFNSGATEGNNAALFGVVHHLRATDHQAPIHILTSKTEHSSIMNSGRALQRLGVDVEFLDVDRHGRVSVDQVRKAIKPHTRLMSFIWVNNEIGSINPIPDLAMLAQEYNVIFHTDGTQAVGKVAVDLSEVPVDLLTFSGHKIYGPKGIGALRVRSGNAKVAPLLYGGGQERGLRSGTVNVPAVVGLGRAAKLCTNVSAENERTASLRDRLVEGLKNAIPNLRLNGHPTERSPINASLTFPGRPVESALPKLEALGFSTGSACSAGRVNISHVLAAIGLSEDDATCTIRLSVGRWTTTEEIDSAIDLLAKAFAG